MCGGSVPTPPPPKTVAQMQAETQNPYENPISGEATPNWKLAAKPPEDTDKKKTTDPKTKKRSELIDSLYA